MQRGEPLYSTISLPFIDQYDITGVTQLDSAQHHVYLYVVCCAGLASLYLTGKFSCYLNLNCFGIFV